MRKIRTTKKAMKVAFAYTISVNYCGLQTLLGAEEPIAYTIRPEGWGADIYDFGNVAIVTGYDPFGNIVPTYETVKKYEEEARKLNDICQYEEKKAALRNLIDQFIEEVVKQRKL